MPKILNIGSINVDYVYRVNHFAKSGETLSVDELNLFPGGKGLNQSIAMAHAGGQVYHVGKTGKDGVWLIDHLKQAGVRTDDIEICDIKTGHAIIQVTPEGQNNILVYGGANFELDKQHLDRVFSKFSDSDILVLQNEVNNIAYMMQKAWKTGMKIAFNPSPITPDITKLPLEYVTYFVLNEIEGRAITGKLNFEDILNEMSTRYPKAVIVLTIGKHGVLCRKDDLVLSHGVYHVPIVDTTAAGDTFTGYFISSIASGNDLAEALRTASLASSIAVSRQGASVSIPKLSEVLESHLMLAQPQ